ncbi:unnamed protein product [Sphagnum tenellum]
MGFDELLRITPWILTILCANIIHYRSLWTAREESKDRVRALRKSAAQSDSKLEHERLTFDLMRAPAMRKARYKIKLMRYCGTTLFVLVLKRYHLPELHERYTIGIITLEVLIVGMLSGLIVVYLNENQEETFRTLWRPSFDFQSPRIGLFWDIVRVLGTSVSVPIEEELFYHSWMYRYMVQLLNRHHYKSFTEVPFLKWSWPAWLASNVIKGIYNGKEWRSYCISGLLFQWMIGRRGLFLDGVFTHAISNLTISCWVLLTGQRQYW